MITLSEYLDEHMRYFRLKAVHPSGVSINQFFHLILDYIDQDPRLKQAAVNRYGYLGSSTLAGLIRDDVLYN